MNYFHYKMITPKGAMSSGIVKLPFNDLLSAIAHLERDGSMTIRVRKLNPVFSFLFNFIISVTRKKLKRLEQAEILSNMALMQRAGITLNAGLREIAESAEFPDIAGEINEMVSNIEGGALFSDTASRHPNIFPKSSIHLIRIGEETGRLDAMLKDASEHLKRIHQIISDTKQALLYPAFVFTAMGGGMVFWFYYVVPKIISLFRDMDVELPPLTIFVMNLSRFVQDYAIQLAIGAVLLIAAIIMGRKSSQKFRKLFDLLMLRVPVAKTIINASNLAFISEYFSLLISTGIDILQALLIMKESVTNEVYKEKLEVVRDGITRGEGIGDSFKNAGIFPPFVTRMVGVGESSGTLPEQLGYIAEEYRNKLAVIVATLGKVLEPVVLLVAGGMFIVIIAALMLPIYDLISRVGG